MKYGEIYWAKPEPGMGSEQAGRRPVLVVSGDEAIDALTHVVTTVPLSTRDRGWATHVLVGGANTGLTQPSWALCEQVRTISIQRIAGRVGEADTATLTSVARLLRYLLDL